MTYPRSHLVDTAVGGCYHVVSRCVRRAWLCGADHSTGKNFDHRRRWIEDRIHFLSKLFAIDIYSYAVMSNHYHIVLKTDPCRPAQWSDDEVAERWLQVCPGRRPRKPDPDLPAKRKAALLADAEQIERLRQRLGSLSWFMRQINEPLARRSNREDGCTGRFWEGRFSSQAVLDDPALLACMVYVDLNPVRARIAEDLPDSKYTSVRHRISLQASQQRLAPINREPDDEDILSYLTVADYLELVRWTSRNQSDYRPGIETIKCPRVLQRRNLDGDEWFSHYLPTPHHWQRAVGSEIALEDYARMVGQCWIKRKVKLASAS